MKTPKWTFDTKTLLFLFLSNVLFLFMSIRLNQLPCYAFSSSWTLHCCVILYNVEPVSWCG